jgi:Uma2 family endonuclease
MTAMTLQRMTEGEYIPAADQCIELRGTWATYEALLAARGERRRPRIAYLDGVVQLMTTSQDHELIKSVMGYFVAEYCLQSEIVFSGASQWTLKARAKKAGLEPDECFIFAENPKRSRKPDLAIEVIWTSGSIDKLEIYRRFGVSEVWFWEADEIAAFVLRRGRYVTADHSSVLPGIDLSLVARLATVVPHSKAIKQFRAALRRQRK